MEHTITLSANAVTGFLLNPTQEDKIVVQQILTYHVKGYEEMPLYKMGRWDGTSTFFKWDTSTFPAGFLLYLAASLKQRGFQVKVIRNPLPEPLGPVHPTVGNYKEDPRYAYQYEAVEKLVKYGNLIAMCATGCHAKGTRVLMYDGTLKNVEDVVVGDALMGTDSKPRNVISLCRGREKMYEITPVSGGHSFVVNASHILSLKQTNVGRGHGARSNSTGQIVNVTVRDYLAWGKHQKHIFKLYRSNGIEFPKKEEFWLDPYVLGLLLGDAHFHKNGSVSITTPDIEIINYLHEWSRMNFLDLRYAQDKRSKALTISFRRHKYPGYKEIIGKKNVYRNPLNKAIFDLGLLGTNSANKFIPHQYKTASREARLKMLAGLLDTDGYESHNGFDYVSKSKQLAEDVAFIARSVGLKVSESIKTIRTGDYAGNSYYRLHITGNCEIIPNLVARKKAEPRQQIKSPTMTGFSIKELPEDDYFGFELDGDHLYLLDDFTVTHNSGKTLICELAFARINRPTLFITTRNLLMYQMKDRFEKDFGEPVSIIGDGHFDTRSKFTVAMVQTLQSRLAGAEPRDKGSVREEKEAIKRETEELLKTFEFIVLEEAHESSGNGYFDVCNHCTNAAYRLALTATPFMKDDEEANMRLMAVSGPIGIKVSEKMLIDRGILARPYFKFVKLAKRPKYLQRRTTWQAAYRIGIVENEERNQLIVDEALKAKEHGLSVMCLVLQKAHGGILQRMMKAQGLKAEFIFGENNANERQERLNDLKEKKIDVLIGSTILDVGVDVPAVGMVILAGAGKAEVAIRQRIGRGLRAKKDTANVCFVVDFADDFNNHLINHAAQRRAIIMNTAGFDEGIVEEFPYRLLEAK